MRDDERYMAEIVDFDDIYSGPGSGPEMIVCESCGCEVWEEDLDDAGTCPECGMPVEGENIGFEVLSD